MGEKYEEIMALSGMLVRANIKCHMKKLNDGFELSVAGTDIRVIECGGSMGCLCDKLEVIVGDVGDGIPLPARYGWVSAADAFAMIAEHKKRADTD